MERQEQHRTLNVKRSYQRAFLVGLIGCLGFSSLLLLASVFCEGRSQIVNHAPIISKSCLVLCAVLCGVVSAAGTGRSRLLHALAGECALFIAVLVCAALRGRDAAAYAIAIDLAVLLFGAFAGTVQKKGTGKLRRGKR